MGRYCLLAALVCSFACFAIAGVIAVVDKPDWLTPPPHIYVLAIGIDRYPDTPLHFLNLEGSVNDARAIAAAFHGTVNGSQPSAYVLENAAATKDKVRATLQRIALTAGAQDMFVLSFSGYAFDKKTPNGHTHYLIPADVRSNEVCPQPDWACLNEQSLISDSLLYSWMTQVRAKRQIILLDSNSTDQAIPLFEEHWRNEGCAVGPEAMKRILMVTNHGFGLEDTFDGTKQGLLTKSTSDALRQASKDGLVTAFAVQQGIYRIWAQSYGLRDSRRSEQVRAELLGGDFVMDGPPGLEVNPERWLWDSGLGPVCYGGPATASASRGSDREAESSAAPSAPENAGPKNYALIVATDNYLNWPHLSNPHFDAETIEGLLKDSYGFEVEQLFDPSREQLEQKLDELHRRKFGPDDQLFIFIAGHGDYDETSDIGYLVFEDSLAGHDHHSQMDLMQLRQRIDTIHAAHILLVMDSCFAGTMDPDIGGEGGRGDYEPIPLPALIKRFAGKKTRIFLTSGGNEYVPDGRPGQHSPFAALFINALQKSAVPDGYLSLAKLPQYFQRLTTAAKMGSLGHNQSGEFFFIPKSSEAASSAQ